MVTGPFSSLLSLFFFVLSMGQKRTYDTSIASSIFPDEMKIAKVIPLFKSGDQCTISNYRPISLLPTLSKMFEKIVCEMLSAHLEQNNFLFDYQFGFRKKEKYFFSDFRLCKQNHRFY